MQTDTEASESPPGPGPLKLVGPTKIGQIYDHILRRLSPSTPIHLAYSEIPLLLPLRASEGSPVLRSTPRINLPPMVRGQHAALCALLLAAECGVAAAAVSLQLTDNMKLPKAFAGDVFGGVRSFELAANVGEKNAIMDSFVFVVGETSILQVIDTSDHNNAASTIVDMAAIGAPGTDVTTCKTWNERLVAVATQGSGGKQDPGRVLLYTVSTQGKLAFKREFQTAVGRLPDQIQWTKDCRTIIAACEGEAVPIQAQGGVNPSLVNPEGGLAVLKFRPAPGTVADDDTATFAFYSFKEANFNVNDATTRTRLLNDGVRWSLRPETKTAGFQDGNPLNVQIPDSETTFSKDLEPEYLALSADGKTVYAAMQEACAVAIFDLETLQFKDIKALKTKSWKNTNAGLDASNRDSGINMEKWDIHGMLMPDTIHVYTAADGVEYLVTANEGDDKEYIWGNEDSVWTEMTRGKDLPADKVSNVPGVLAADIADQAKLGRIKIGTFEGACASVQSRL